MAVENEHKNSSSSSSSSAASSSVTTAIAATALTETTTTTTTTTTSSSSSSSSSSIVIEGNSNSCNNSSSGTINGICSNNINNSINNNNNNINTGNHHQQQQQQGKKHQQQQHQQGIKSTSTKAAMNIVSETSSNESASDSIKKVSSSSNVLQLMNSREDITSLGGGSSINSQLTNNTKGLKDNLPHHYYNGGETRHSNANHADTDDDGLGPLPPKWEKAYTESGELYFIDHNTGTSHWLDPRLSKFQKKSLEDCMDDELPYGWEKIHDPQYGTYFIDHVNRRTQYENPVLEAKRRVERSRRNCGNGGETRGTGSDTSCGNNAININNRNSNSSTDRNGSLTSTNSNRRHIQQKQSLPYTFTRNPAEMRGKRITTTLLKSSRGLGITIVGGDDNVDEFLQIKSIVPNGPAWLDGKLQTGDILVYVNDTCVLGFTHHEMVNVFQSILPGETVTLEVCRGYPLPFDPNDPNTEVVTTIAVDGISSDPEKTRMLMDLNMDGNYNFLDLSDSVGAVGGGGIGDNTSVRNGNITGSGVLQKNPLAKIQSGSIGNELDIHDDIGNENYIGDEFVMFKKPETLNISIVKGTMGFGFTIADSAYGQKVKKILDRNCCKNLQEGDILLEINHTSVKHMSHSEVVQVLKDCPKTKEALLKIQRGHYYSSTNSANFNTRTNNGKLRKTMPGIKDGISNGGLFRSKTPTADLYSTQPKEVLPIRPKTPLVDTRRARVKTPSNELNEEIEAVTRNLEKNDLENKSIIATDAKSNNSLQENDSINNDIPFMDPFPKLVTSLSERLAEASLIQDNHHTNLYQHPLDHHHHHIAGRLNFENTIGGGGGEGSGSEYNYNSPYSNTGGILSVGTGGVVGGHNSGGNIYLSSTGPLPIITPVPTYHHDTCYCFECQDYNRYQMDYHHHQTPQLQIDSNNGGIGNSNGLNHQYIPSFSINQNGGRLPSSKRINEFTLSDRKNSFNPLDAHHHPPLISGIPPQHFINSSTAGSQVPPPPPLWKYGISPNSVAATANLIQPITEDEYTLSEVTLERQALGFGFRIVGGTEEGSQVTVGHIVPGGAADGDFGIATGDEILSIDGVNVVNASHHKVVSLMGEAALRGQVTMILRRRVCHSAPPIQRYPYDVIVSRHENEGFGFVIISSSNQYYGSTIGKLIPGSPADRCGELKVGDSIIAVNRIDIAGMSHGDVVNLIKESGLHVRLTIGCPKDLATPTPTNSSSVATTITSTTSILPKTLLSSPQSSIQAQQQQQSSLNTIKSDPQQQQQQYHQSQSHSQSSYSDRSQLLQHPQL